MLTHDLAERPVGDAVPVCETSTRTCDRGGILGSERIPQLLYEPRLPHSGLPDDRHEMRLGVHGGPPIRRAKKLELAVTAHEDAREAADATRPHHAERANDRDACHPARLPLGLDDPRNADLERARGGGGGSLAGEDLAWLGGLLEPVARRSPRLPRRSRCRARAARRRPRRCSRRCASRARRRTASSSRPCIASAACSARSAWSSSAAGAPNTAITASPANFSTVPPVRSISSDIAS